MSRQSRLRRAKLVLLALGMLGASAVLGALAVVAWTALGVRAAKKPPWLGNAPENVARLVARADPDDLIFLVVGDVQHGTETFEQLLAATATEQPDFVVILGDFVGRPEPARHRLFLHEMGEQHLRCPVFLVAGNHDVSPQGAFRIEDFARLYGPAQFHFTLGKCLFVFLNNAPAYSHTSGYLRFLERVLSEHAGAADHVFVFMHCPPVDLSPLVDSRSFHGSSRFKELARRHRVDYVFAGDYHGYWRGERGGTTYLVSGGGGARLRGKHGRFHHAVRVAVEKGAVNDTVVATRRCDEAREMLERNIVVHVWPLLTGHWARAALTAACSVAAIAALVLLARRWRRLRAPGLAEASAAVVPGSPR